MADGKVIIEIDANSEKLEKVLNVMKSDATNTAKSIGEAVSSAGKELTNFGTSMTKYITTPVLAAGTASVKFASDYDENLNKVDAAFKDSANTVKEWAETATEQFGLSENAALEATSLFGDMGTSMGLTTEQAAEMAVSLTGLAGDLSSFKNIGIDQAMTALKGVFTGETESLKELGVVMTETNLQEFAEGLGLVYDEMSQTEKVTLRYQYVLDKTKNAQGDYARTSDGTANSLRTMKAEAENLAVVFGQELVPSITPMIQEATELIRKFGELDEETKQNIIQAGLLAAAAGPVATVLGKITDGTGSLISAAGKATKALAGGSGLGGAITAALGSGGAAGLAIGVTAALTAGVVVLLSKASEAIDPIHQLQNAIEGIGTAQESVTVSTSIIDLANRYEDLRAKMKDTTLSASELSSVESELDSVRAELSAATGGAVSAEGDYNSALDETVAIQKTLAEIERERAKQEIYDYLKEGADDYKYALEELAQKEADLEEAEAQRSASSQAYTEGTDQAYQGLLDTLDTVQSKLDEGLIDSSTVEGTQEIQGALKMLEDEVNSLITTGEKVHFDSFAEASAYIEDMDYSTQDAADSVADAQAKMDELNGEISDLKNETSGYDNVLRSLIDSGLLSAEEAAGMLDMSVEELNDHLEQCGNTTDDATDSTEGLEDAATNTSNALDEEAEAAEEASNKLRDIGNSAIEAKYTGGDLREAYDELSSQFDEVKESGDATAVKFAELALESLNLAATNQELAQSYSGYVEVLDTAGISLSELSSWLISNEITAEEWASQVASATDTVVNGFEKLDTSLDMSLQTMADNLQYNITAYSNWASNIQILMDAAVATGSQAAVDFVMCMQEMGVGAAVQVQDMVNNIDWTMATFPPMMEEATASGMLSVYNGIEGEKVNVSNAASEVMSGASTEIENADLGTAATTSSSEIPTAIEAQKGSVEAASQELAMAAHTTIATIGWTDLGSAIAQGIANGILNDSGLVESAASVAAESINISQFEYVGQSSGRAFSTGIQSQESSIRSSAQSIATSVTTVWTSFSGKFQQSGSVAGTRIRTGLLQQMTSIRSAGQTLATSVNTAWTATMGQFQQTGALASTALATGIGSGQYAVTSTASSVIYAAQRAMNIGGWYDLGYNISAGVASGVRGGSYLITQAAQAAAQNALASAKASLGVNSPSRVFRDEVGRMIPAGIALGIEDAIPVAVDAMELSADEMLRATQIALRPSGSNFGAQYQYITNNNTTYHTAGNSGPAPAQETAIYLDSREIARAIAKPTGRRMAYQEGL